MTHADETLNLALFEDASVCSCDDIHKCYQLYSHQLKNKPKNLINSLLEIKTASSSLCKKNKLKRIKYTVLRQPSVNIRHLSNSNETLMSDDDLINRLRKQSLKEKSQLDMDDIKRLAIESDFITNRILKRRASI